MTDLRKALSRENLIQVGEATKIAPHVLQNLIDGKYTPTAAEVDALKGYFLGEYFMCGIDSNWKRSRKTFEGLKTLPLSSPVVLGTRKYNAFAPPPMLKAGQKPTGKGNNGEAFTGTGLVIR